MGLERFIWPLINQKLLWSSWTKWHIQFWKAYITVDSDKASILAIPMAKFCHADWCQTRFAFLREQKHLQALFSKLLANRFSTTNVKTVWQVVIVAIFLSVAKWTQNSVLTFKKISELKVFQVVISYKRSFDVRNHHLYSWLDLETRFVFSMK